MANNNPPDIDNKLKKISKDIEKTVRSLNIAAKPLQDAAKSLNISIQPLQFKFEKINKSIQEITSTAYRHFEELIKNQPAVKKYEEKMMKMLGERGWYIDPEMNTTYLPKIIEIFNQGDMKKAENILVKYYRSRLSNIARDLCVKHPTRQIILTKAFTAHRRGDYEISIPAFLTQIDGIYFDLVKEYFFTKKSKKFYKELEKLSQDIFLGSYYFPLVNDFPISYNPGQRKKYKGWNKLNRHQILHGEVTDYGTEKNGLKAISLLNYVSWVLNFDEVKNIVDSKIE